MKKLLLILLVLLAGCSQAEKICTQDGTYMGLSEAISIAERDCNAPLTGKSMCNDVTGTWWLDVDLEKEGCNPACVVDIDSGKAEINWRCTGLIQ